jgi:hypothetical protein
MFDIFKNSITFPENYIYIDLSPLLLVVWEPPFHLPDHIYSQLSRTPHNVSYSENKLEYITNNIFFKEIWKQIRG